MILREVLVEGGSYKHATCILRWNGVETVASMSLKPRIHVVCLQEYPWHPRININRYITRKDNDASSQKY